MPRALKSDKFFIYAAGKSGFFKGKRLMGVNWSYRGIKDSITIQDLIDFLKEKKIDASKVFLLSSFKATAEE